MGRSRQSLKPSLLLLSTALTLSLLSTGVLGQQTTTATTTADAQTTTASATSTSDGGSTTSTAMPTIGSDTTDATTSTSSMPAISSSAATTDTNILTDMPTVSKGTTIPTYAVTVPPTNNAPFMKQSSAPDGTVFIAVGAILGAFGLAILSWRLIVSCLLHRSVERAAMAQYHANDKAAFPGPSNPFYKYSDQGSAPNVAPATGRGVRRTTRGPVPSGTPSQTNLFFSPTAAGGAATTAAADRRDSSYRDSRFLPSGFYAAGSGSPQNNGQGHGHSISLTNLRPQSMGGPGRAESPASPSFGPQRTSVHMHNMSNSSVNLNQPLNQPPVSGQRAPSHFLEDLLDERPDMFPPSNMPPSAHNNSSHPYRNSSQHGGRF